MADSQPPSLPTSTSQSLMKLSSYIPFYLLTLAEAKFYLIDTSGDYGLAKPIEENDS